MIEANSYRDSLSNPRGLNFKINKLFYLPFQNAANNPRERGGVYQKHKRSLHKSVYSFGVILILTSIWARPLISLVTLANAQGVGGIVSRPPPCSSCLVSTNKRPDGRHTRPSLRVSVVAPSASLCKPLRRDTSV